MSLRTAGSVLVVFLWSVAVVLGQNVWSVTYTTQSICVLEGSTVELSCSIRYPSGTVTSTVWFTKWGTGVEPEDLGQDPEYAGRLEYHGDKKNGHNLRITDLREKDSATYKFRFITDQTGWKYTGYPGVTLSVTGLQVKVTGGHQDKTLTCITTCTLTGNPTYIWYKNGQHLDESTSPQYKDLVSSNYDDSYSCAVKGHEDLHSPAVCVQDQICYRVTYTKRRICVLKGSTVDISCTYVGYYSTTSTFWFRSDKSTPEDLTSDPGYTGRVKYTGTYEGPSILRITDLREEDSAEYRFTFKTDNFEWGHSFPGTTLSVTGLQVKVTPAAEGQKTLTCITTCTLTGNPTYIWYKNGQRLDESTSPQYKDPVSSNYEDSYSCAVKGHEDLHSPAVCVQDQICSRVTYTKRRICVLKGSTVDISCTYVGYYSTTSTFWFRSDKSTPEDLTRDPGYTGRVKYTGTYRCPFTLRITDLREEDSAEYRFTFKTYNVEWGHSFPGTTLSVTGLQVKVTPAAEGQKTLTCITTCTLTDNPTYIWYKNGQHLDESTSPQYKYSVSSNYVDSYSCAVKGHEDLHSPAVCVQDQICSRVTYTKRRICVLKGSTVDISCTYVGYYSTTSTFWFRSDKSTPEDLTRDPGYTGRVKYTGTYRCPFTLRITDLREEDSAEYRFTFKTYNVEWGHSFPGTTLSVTGLQVKVTPAAEGQKTLTCITTCTLTDNPTYIWYKNGQHLDESTSPQYKYSVSSNYVDSYSCAVKGHEDLHSPAVCVQGQICNRVTYTKRRICVLKGSTVEISCTYVGYYSTTSTFWFRSDKSTPEDLTRDPGYTGRVKYTGTYRGPSILRITDLREEDSAEYRFTFKTDNFEWGHSFPGTTLTVTDLQVKVIPDTVTEGSWVKLTCSTTCTLTEIPNPTYIWYKNGEYLFSDSSPQYQYSVSRGGSDSYSCTLRGHEKLSSSKVTVDLQVKVSPDTEAGKRTLTCSTTCSLTVNPTYIWYRNGQSLAWPTSQQYSVWSSETESYSCAVKGHEELHSPAVCAQGDNCWRVTYTKRRICVLKGSTVNISCSYTHPTSYIEQGSFWFTQKHPVDFSSYPEYAGRVEYNRNTENHHTMTITDLTEKDSAEYKFRLLTTHDGRFSGLPGVMLTVTDILLEMHPTSVSEGERVTLRCRTKCPVSLNPTYIWYKNGQRLTKPITSYNSLILDPVSSEDTGNYSCAVEGFERILSPEETLTVRFGPKNTSVSVSPSGEIVEGSSVTLTCSSDANPPVDKYTWYKKNGASLTGSEKTYNFTTISSEDRGEYYCEAENKYGRLISSSLPVDVQYGPKNTSVSVSPSGEIVEGSSVTLTCSSDANPPVDKYTWYKKNVTSPKASGQSYIITNIISEDRGEYYCEAQNGRGSMNSTSLMIIVAGKQTSVMTAAVGIIVVVLVLILCLSVFMWFRKKASTSPSDTRDTADDGQGDSSPVYDNISSMAMTPTAAQTAATDDQDDVHYASVHFSRSKNQEVPLYSTVQKQDEDVQYAAVKFNHLSAATQPTAAQAAEVDPSVLYSTVNKPRNKKT
ncbi:titin isoform X2 [Salmo salar]|uniref:B-cell receptor CD22 n=1 Tax=Salmo salar TaxID=8030 RepID=A0ABM3EC10_SALSA|nr:titin-like isoform X2 [Salmo salar]